MVSLLCHGRADDPVHRVCTVSADGHEIVRSHGGQPGSDTGHCNGPSYLAVDNNEFVFVADEFNRRVTLLSPTLNYIRQVVSRDQVEWDRACFLHLDVERRRLYVGEEIDDEWSEEDEDYPIGRVVVFSM